MPYIWSPWASKQQAREFWPDAVSLSDDVLDTLLQAATEQCIEYAPTLADGVAPPVRYMLGCVYQAREIYSASVRGESDVVGVGDFVIRARPLTAAVKQLLRPQRVSWGVG